MSSPEARSMRSASPFLAGLLFGIGLCLSGMIYPSKVLAFLDLAGAWDPSLAFVMGGAVAVAFVAFRIAARRRTGLAGGPYRAAADKNDRRAADRRIGHFRRRLGAGRPLSGSGDRQPRLFRPARGAVRPLHDRRHGASPASRRRPALAGGLRGSFARRLIRRLHLPYCDHARPGPLARPAGTCR